MIKWNKGVPFEAMVVPNGYKWPLINLLENAGLYCPRPINE